MALAAQWANDRTVQLHVETLVHALGRLHPEFVAIERKSRKQHCAMEFITKVIEIMAETLQELEEYKVCTRTWPLHGTHHVSCG